ncbi:MAG TPA: hypothetical protein VIT22_06450 [Pseudoxanthomonas sp.]
MNLLRQAFVLLLGTTFIFFGSNGYAQEQGLGIEGQAGGAYYGPPTVADSWLFINQPTNWQAKQHNSVVSAARTRAQASAARTEKSMGGVVVDTLMHTPKCRGGWAVDCDPNGPQGYGDAHLNGGHSVVNLTVAAAAATAVAGKVGAYAITACLTNPAMCALMAAIPYSASDDTRGCGVLVGCGSTNPLAVSLDGLALGEELALIHEESTQRHAAGGNGQAAAASGVMAGGLMAKSNAGKTGTILRDLPNGALEITSPDAAALIAQGTPERVKTLSGTLTVYSTDPKMYDGLHSKITINGVDYDSLLLGGPRRGTQQRDIFNSSRKMHEQGVFVARRQLSIVTAVPNPVAAAELAYRGFGSYEICHTVTCGTLRSVVGPSSSFSSIDFDKMLSPQPGTPQGTVRARLLPKLRIMRR